MTLKEAYEIHAAFTVYVEMKRKILIQPYSLEQLEEARSHLYNQYNQTPGYLAIVSRIAHLKKHNALLSHIVYPLLVAFIIFICSGIGLYIKSEWTKARIHLGIRWAHNLKDSSGKTYQGATEQHNWVLVNNADPIPINININDKSEQSIVFGVNNTNTESLKRVQLDITLPQEFEFVPKTKTWIPQGNNRYTTYLGDIPSAGEYGQGINGQEPIYFVAQKAGEYEFIYGICGDNFRAISRTGKFSIYSSHKTGNK